MPELKALTRECRLRGYSRLRKAELIALLQDNEHQAQRRPPPRQTHTRAPEGPEAAPPVPTLQMSTWESQREPQTEVRQPTRWFVLPYFAACRYNIGNNLKI